MYIDKKTLQQALSNLYGSAGHLVKIWFVLKHMGLGRADKGVEIDTSNSTPSLKRLFSCGAENGEFYIPFAHTPRYLHMKHDASRSIIQTTIQRWATSGSVVTCDPTEYLNIGSNPNGKLTVNIARRYPFGLGHGESGFALEDGMRVAIPLASFAVWYGRSTLIPEDVDACDFLVKSMLDDLGINEVEKQLIFVDDDLVVSTKQQRLSEQEIFACCSSFIEGEMTPEVIEYKEPFDQYSRKVNSIMSGLNKPIWMRESPSDVLKNVLEAGETAILLFGPPRTGKTRLVDEIEPRNSDKRFTIQIHDGWGYDNLVQGLKPKADGSWCWEDGPLKEALESGKKLIVLEEINRTAITQALGEVFSLIEKSYRGEKNAILLRSGQYLYIPEDVVFIMTMNTIDKSTEEVDDALIGRLAAIEVPPRTEDLVSMLETNGVGEAMRIKISELFAEIQNVYPLGHGYFSGIAEKHTIQDVLRHYKTRVRPVIKNFVGELNASQLDTLDNIADNLFQAK